MENDHKEGECPVCKHNSLEYGALEIIDGNVVAYPWECSNCGAQGAENYILTFLQHSIALKHDMPD